MIPDTRTVGPALARYLGGLILAGEEHDGSPFEVLPWERRFELGASGVEGDAALSVARGNGKSAVVAGVAGAVANPSGPFNRRRREVALRGFEFPASGDRVRGLPGHAGGALTVGAERLESQPLES